MDGFLGFGDLTESYISIGVVVFFTLLVSSGSVCFCISFLHGLQSSVMIIALKREHVQIDKLYDICRALFFRGVLGFADLVRVILLFPFEWLYFPCCMCRLAVFVLYISWIPVHW